MKLGLINSAWAQAGRETAFGIRMTKEIGFDSIDIFADPLDIDARERRRIRQECARVHLPIISVACVAVGLIDFNPSGVALWLSSWTQIRPSGPLMQSAVLPGNML